ncbi:Antibiotic biosynthesis monooxygenase [Planctomycetes bacterium Pan216]|uniref:Antibiotic biosynthesis monooxygenase n=1 Tax=Kolteria novifilia TaxID=2527975 RepID=A0A518BC93_9BACT|nr:Antibiotic biosynthesis monooxygenase [Planctomycetes bacterium Pan216]
MIYLNVYLQVKEASDVPNIAEALTRAGEKSRQEPGCHRWEAYHSKNDPNRFLLVEHWESQEHLDQHREAEAYQQIYKVDVLPKVDREGHPADLL